MHPRSIASAKKIELIGILKKGVTHEQLHREYLHH
ncbi:hypothetical protein VPHD273_0039 [Vibrio phage D273]